MKKYGALYVFLLIVAGIFSQYCQANDPRYPSVSAQKGVLDLRQVDLSKIFLYSRATGAFTGISY